MNATNRAGRLLVVAGLLIGLLIGALWSPREVILSADVDKVVGWFTAPLWWSGTPQDVAARLGKQAEFDVDLLRDHIVWEVLWFRVVGASWLVCMLGVFLSWVSAKSAGGLLRNDGRMFVVALVCVGAALGAGVSVAAWMLFGGFGAPFLMELVATGAAVGLAAGVWAVRAHGVRNASNARAGAVG